MNRKINNGFSNEKEKEQLWEKLQEKNGNGIVKANNNSATA